MSDFAELLRRLRLEAGLSQESLAEHAGISVKAISAYEQGARSAPRRDTIALLVEALHLSGEARADFEYAAERKRAPVPSSASEPRHNLPVQRSSFVGREREIGEISGLLAPRQLVTVTGAGGIGKTRTALEVASRLTRSPRDGIWFVDLGPLASGDLVLSKLASILDLQIPEQPDVLAAVVAAIKARELLLVLDNCEHVIGTIRSVAGAILDACPQITLLATSRERLGIAGERTYQMSTLPSNDALELFAERAATAKHGFLFSEAQVEAAVDICRRLDGIALAIELAAARLPVLGLSELRARLTKHFQVIAGGRHDLPARQQTLNATISWSHDLLDEPERVLFRRLAIFTSGWTLESAQSVCAGGALEKTWVLDALCSLVEKSLVVVAGIDADTPRYSFFESTRAYALEQLAAGTDGPDLSRRYAQWMATFADRAYDSYLAIPRRPWEIAMAPDLDNAIAALEWARGPEGDVVLAARIASGLRGFWLTAGLGGYGRRYVNEALERIDAQEHPAHVARLLLAQVQFLVGTACVDALQRAILLLDGVGDRQMLATCYGRLSYALALAGRHSDAEEASDKTLALLREAGLQRSLLYMRHLTSRSAMFRMQGRLDDAKATLTEALPLAIALEDEWSISGCHNILAEIEFAEGDARRALVFGEESLASARRVRAVYQETYALCNLACFQLALGELDAAEAIAQEALDLARSSNPITLCVYVAIQHLATVAALRGQPSHAARLLGYVNAWYERVGSHRDPTEQKGRDILVESLRKQLSDDELSTLATQGALLSEDAAVEEALMASCMS